MRKLMKAIKEMYAEKPAYYTFLIGMGYMVCYTQGIVECNMIMWTIMVVVMIIAKSVCKMKYN